MQSYAILSGRIWSVKLTDGFESTKIRLESNPLNKPSGKPSLDRDNPIQSNNLRENKDECLLVLTKRQKSFFNEL